jgi:two-component system, chemotaxis family, protein-glutamate methylesterase/glutaminase
VSRQAKRILAPGARIRVLVVDDSVVIRRLLAHTLSEDPDLEVIGTAADGRLALRFIALHMPDAVTLDLEMPEMDGLETLREIRLRYPDLIVIMFSALSERGATITLEALALGANDYVTKAVRSGSLDRATTRLHEELVPKLKQFFVKEAPVSAAVSIKPRPDAAARRAQPRHAVAIGISTGGPTALAELAPMFPATFPLPVFIVQHMPPIFTRLLAERLQTLTALRVREAAENMPVDCGTIYIAPGDFHMRVARRGTREFLQLDQTERQNSCRPAVDALFRSVADVYGGGVVAAILTGMGSDGLLGAQRLHTEGAYLIAQNEASSVVWGMPGAVVNAGLADAVVDLKSIVPEILEHI